MTQIHLADLVLIFHFGIVIFVTCLFLIIPLGYKFKWKWIKNRKIRLTHFFLIFFVTIETIFGLTCPLTLIEFNLRGVIFSDSFISIWLQNLLYWNFPKEYFLISYIACLIWTIFMWYKFPPNNKDKDKINS